MKFPPSETESNPNTNWKNLSQQNAALARTEAGCQDDETLVIHCRELRAQVASLTAELDEACCKSNDHAEEMVMQRELYQALLRERKLQGEQEQAIHKQLLAERDQLTAERDQLRAERDEALQERNIAEAEIVSLGKQLARYRNHSMKSIPLQVFDVIETPGHVAPRLYVVHGIHLGALNQESVIELVAMDQNTPDAHGEKQHMFVPNEMIQAGLSAGLFNHTRA